MIIFCFADADIKKYLKNLNLELASLPTPLLETLNNYARIKNDTELHSLDTSYLDEFYLLKKKEKLHNSEIIADLTLTINQFHDETKRDREQLDILEKFLQVHSTKSHEDIENERLAIEQKIAGVDAAYVSTPLD